MRIIFVNRPLLQEKCGRAAASTHVPETSFRRARWIRIRITTRPQQEDICQGASALYFLGYCRYLNL